MGRITKASASKSTATKSKSTLASYFQIGGLTPPTKTNSNSNYSNHNNHNNHGNYSNSNNSRSNIKNNNMQPSNDHLKSLPLPLTLASYFRINKGTKSVSSIAEILPPGLTSTSSSSRTRNDLIGGSGEFFKFDKIFLFVLDLYVFFYYYFLNII